MTSGGRLIKLARTRQLYTGEPFHVAKETVRGGNNRSPLPVASVRQARLEAETFAKLCGGGQWWAHPFGIASVQAEAKSAVVYLDSHTTFRSGDPYPRSAHALDDLLPGAELGVQVNGIVGLRVAGIEGPDLHLTLAGGECHLILRGTAGTDWAEELDERWHRLEKAGSPPLWQEPQLTSHEETHIRDYPRVWRAHRGLDWLGSALLRRIAVFHTSSTAYSSRSWIHDDEWIFELDTVRGIKLDHDAFLSRLMDPLWGIPLRIHSQHCSCDPDHQLGHSTYTLQCTYHLAHPDTNGRGGLQLRFRHGPGAYSGGTRSTLERLGSPAKWLDRVLPKSSPDVSSSPDHERTSRSSREEGGS
ncbi:hypothetical protein GCM10010324_17800 [Streptomyces hiroshimensis]|uniref:Uncharacterized protein n=1 Tax=Streptomyces hiroshimensis TaxID=66424 RepID=A0ABQ2Y8E6_9ACTN|nr:hypothetical protein GCM10010324_17800 [Streptomyces hiroshimensis]